MADLQKAQQIYDSMSAEQRKQFEQQYWGEQKAQDFLQSQQDRTPIQPQSTTRTQSTPTPKQEIQPQKAPTATTQQWRPELLPESDYKDDSDQRQRGIVANLNEAVYLNPQSLSDYNTFANYYNHEGRSDLQKQTLDNRYLWYQKSQEYSTKSVKELQSLYNANVISQSDLSLLKVYDPNKYNELNSLISKTADLKTYADQLSGTEITTPTNPFQWIIDNFVQWLQSFSQTNFYDEYRDTINSPALKQKNQEIIAEQAEMERLDLLINNKRKDVEERYAGTGATKSKIAAIIADETYELQLDKANRAITLNAMVNSYNSELGNAREELNLKLQEYNMGLQQRQQQMQELWFAMSLMNFETNAQRDEREWNNFIRQQEYQNWDIFSNDPKVRNKAIEKAVDTVLQEFSGIPMIRSREQMVEDITVLVNGGMSLWEAITKNIREPIMNKSEYKQRHSQTFGEKAPQIYNVGGNDYVWNEKTGAFESVPTYEGPTGMSEFIGRWEWFRENAYQDVGGVWTIGYGFTKVNGVPVKAGDKITREQADVEFQKQISQYQNWRNYITTPLSEAQETALTSFEYNLGQWIWTKSVWGAMWVIDSINNGDLQWAADLMKKFNKAKIDGVLKEVKGLSNRRNEEAQLLMQTWPSIVGGVEVTWLLGEKYWQATYKNIDDFKKSVLSDFSVVEQWYIEDLISGDIKLPNVPMEHRDRVQMGKAILDRKENRPLTNDTIRLYQALENVYSAMWDTNRPVSEGIFSPDVLADWRYIKQNLSLENVVAARQKGVTFGAMSEGERSIMADAASAMKWYASGSKNKKEIENVIRTVVENNPRLQDYINERGTISNVKTASIWPAVPEEVAVEETSPLSGIYLPINTNQSMVNITTPGWKQVTVSDYIDSYFNF